MTEDSAHPADGATQVIFPRPCPTLRSRWGGCGGGSLGRREGVSGPFNGGALGGRGLNSDEISHDKEHSEGMILMLLLQWISGR